MPLINHTAIHFVNKNTVVIHTEWLYSHNKTYSPSSLCSYTEKSPKELLNSATSCHCYQAQRTVSGAWRDSQKRENDDGRLEDRPKELKGTVLVWIQDPAAWWGWGLSARMTVAIPGWTWQGLETGFYSSSSATPTLRVIWPLAGRIIKNWNLFCVHSHQCSCWGDWKLWHRLPSELRQGKATTGTCRWWVKTKKGKDRNL